MSTKRPDVLKTPPSSLTCLTLSEMHVAHWQLRAQCRCGVDFRVSLPTWIRTYGPDHIGWGMSPPCPGWLCTDGTLVITARTLRGGSWVNLSAHRPTDLDIQRWKNARPNYLGPR